MKRILWILTLLILNEANSQTLNPTSTAEELRSYIEKAGKTCINHPIKDEYYIKELFFDGGSLIIKKDYVSMIFEDRYSNIKWEDLDNISVSEPEDGLIKINLQFKNKQIVEENLGYLKSDHEYWPNRISMWDIDTTGSVSIPVSEKNKNEINNLKIAIRRLADLSKKSKLFSNSYSSKIKLIPGKPKLGETIKYINEFLRSSAASDLRCHILYLTNRKHYLSFNGESEIDLISKYVENDDYYKNRVESKSYDFIIHLNKIESISIYGKGFQGYCSRFGLDFEESGQSEGKMHLPLWISSDTKNSDTYKEERIYKAFEHLRKMLGARDPIEF